MSHYAIIAPPLYSHVRALEALAQPLLARGHRITFFQQAQARTLLRDPRSGFIAVGDAERSPPLAQTLRLMAHPAGTGMFRLIDHLAQTTDTLCRELPAAFARAGIDGVIADQMEAAGGLVAEAMGLPFVSVACALPVNRDETLPLAVMPFSYGTDARSRKRYQTSTRIYDWLMRSHGAVIARHARAFGLGERRGLQDCLSPLAQVAQTLPGFDFPRHLPECFHAVGPLRAAALPPLGEKQPLAFASLGTLQGHRFRLFRTVARACQQTGIRLLIAHCGGLNVHQTARLRDDGARTVDFADQPAVLRRASVVITHAGLNTVMDAIATATPVLAVPLAFDQPGVAARVEYCGIGRRLSRFAGHDAFAESLYDLLTDEEYRHRLLPLRAELERAGGAARGAAIVEQALETRQPVVRGSIC
ncbi:glycosyltransferase [Pseudenterobacter timonensis]|uniref:Glycosyltransferase n=1 Tax=Pseudenterobacter timonensis TaxID=1755099 RepID=A0ABV4ACG3_9ENTR